MDFIKNYAIDLAKKSLTVSDIYDSQALLQSIENILLTVPGERVFEPEFGSFLTATTFRNLTTESGERLLDSLIKSITRFEPRVKVISSKCQLMIDKTQNSVSIKIVFVSKDSNTPMEYTKKLQS